MAKPARAPGQESPEKKPKRPREKQRAASPERALAVRPALSLDGIHAKVARGREHASAIKDEIRAWFHAKPYFRTVEVNGDRTCWTVRLNPRRPLNTRLLSLAFGDAVQNVRASLDHFFFAIADRYSRPDLGIQQRKFPIISQKKRFDEVVEALPKWNIPPDVWAAIEQEQPYNRPNSGLCPLLELLNRLSIVDKHHMLAVVLSPVTKMGWTNYESPHPVELIMNKHMMLGIDTDKDAIVTSLTIREPATDMNPECNLTTHINVALSPWDAWKQPVFIDLGAITGVLADEVVAVVERISAAVT